MRLVIEREGGFDVIEDSDAITKIDVQSFGVKVSFMAADGGEWSEVYPVADHAAACRLSAAIAAKCGELVEPLAVQPEVDGEDVMHDATAALVRKNSKPWTPTVKRTEWVAGDPPKDGEVYEVEHMDPMGTGSRARVKWAHSRWFRVDDPALGLGMFTAWFRVTCEPEPVMPKVASEWTRGEPPKNGMTYVAREGVNSLCVQWDGERWMAGGMPVVFGAGVVHLPTALTMEGMARPVSEWVDGEPPRDGRWYVVMRDDSTLPHLQRWEHGSHRWVDSEGWKANGGTEAHLPTPIPNR